MPFSFDSKTLDALSEYFLLSINIIMHLRLDQTESNYQLH